jgi:divalent metal cation (Fe/Co/Zn/Cd) transporter
MASAPAKRTVYAAIGANLAIAATKFVAAGITGSSATTLSWTLSIGQAINGRISS